MFLSVLIKPAGMLKTAALEVYTVITDRPTALFFISEPLTSADFHLPGHPGTFIAESIHATQIARRSPIKVISCNQPV